MNILTRYVLREFILAWLVALTALSVMLCGSQFARALERAADSHLPNEIVPQLVLATFVQSLPIVAPLSVILGIVFVIGRLCHDSELSAMRAAGLSMWRITRPILFVATLCALVIAWLTLQLSPAMASREQSLLADGLRRAQLAAFQPGRFTQVPHSSTVIHVRARGADGMLQQLMIARLENARIEVITARRATIATSAGGRAVSIMAYDGVRAEGVPGEGAARLMRFARLSTQVAFEDVRRVRTSRDFLPSSELWISTSTADVAELQWRWSLPLMCVVLAYIAVPLSVLRPRQGRYARVLPVLLVFFLYINALTAGRNAVSHGALGRLPGMWSVHLGFALVAALIIAWPALRRIVVARR